MPVKGKVGLYGLAMHTVVTVLFLRLRAARGEQFGAELLFVALPLLLLCAFAVYAFVVSRYLTRRAGMQNPLFIDMLVGMLVEYVIFTAAAAFLGIYDGLRAGGVLSSVAMSILWVYATFMIQILLLGNLCGLVGWLILKKYPRSI